MTRFLTLSRVILFIGIVASCKQRQIADAESKPRQEAVANAAEISHCNEPASAKKVKISTISSTGNIPGSEDMHAIVSRAKGHIIQFSEADWENKAQYISIDFNGTEINRVCDWSKKLCKTVVFGAFLKSGVPGSALPYNAAIVCNAEGQRNYYIKSSLAEVKGEDGSLEADHVQAGRGIPLVFNTSIRIGIAICSDVYGDTSMNGYIGKNLDLLLVPMCWAPDYANELPEVLVNTGKWLIENGNPKAHIVSSNCADGGGGLGWVPNSGNPNWQRSPEKITEFEIDFGE